MCVGGEGIIFMQCITQNLRDGTGAVPYGFGWGMQQRVLIGAGSEIFLQGTASVPSPEEYVPRPASHYPNTISPKSSGRWNAGTALVTGFHAR